MDGRVRKDKEFSSLSQVLFSVDVWEEDEGSAKEGLEELSQDTSLKEVSELSQHEELQDLKPHSSKTV